MTKGIFFLCFTVLVTVPKGSTAYIELLPGFGLQFDILRALRIMLEVEGAVEEV